MRYLEASINGLGLTEMFEDITESIVFPRFQLSDTNSEQQQIEDTNVAYRKEKKSKRPDNSDNSASDNEAGDNKKAGQNVTQSFRLDDDLDCSYWGTPKKKCSC